MFTIVLNWKHTYIYIYINKYIYTKERVEVRYCMFTIALNWNAAVRVAGQQHPSWVDT